MENMPQSHQFLTLQIHMIGQFRGHQRYPEVAEVFLGHFKLATSYFEGSSICLQHILISDLPPESQRGCIARPSEALKGD